MRRRWASTSVTMSEFGSPTFLFVFQPLPAKTPQEDGVRSHGRIMLQGRWSQDQQILSQVAMFAGSLHQGQTSSQWPWALYSQAGLTTAPRAIVRVWPDENIILINIFRSNLTIDTVVYHLILQSTLLSWCNYGNIYIYIWQSCCK